MKIKTPVATTAFLFCAAASATDVEVHIQNLSNETIQTSQHGFPRLLSPGQAQSVILNFPDTGSQIDVTYTSKSGKTCTFSGYHRVYGKYDIKRGKEAIGSASYINCGAILNVRKWSSPYHYRLGFWMTD